MQWRQHLRQQERQLQAPRSRSPTQIEAAEVWEHPIENPQLIAGLITAKQHPGVLAADAVIHHMPVVLQNGLDGSRQIRLVLH